MAGLILLAHRYDKECTLYKLPLEIIYMILEVNMWKRLIKLYKQHPNNWNWKRISSNPNITWDIIKANPDKPWDWHGISLNPSITLDIITSNPGNHWDWESISNNPSITWDIMTQKPDKMWSVIMTMYDYCLTVIPIRLQKCARRRE